MIANSGANLVQARVKGPRRRGAKINAKEKDAPIHERHALVHTNYVTVREAAQDQKQTYAFGREHVREEKRESFFIVGFDTEYKTPSNSFDNKQIQEGKAKYEVLSYQFYAKNETGEEWSGLILPDDQERVSFSDFITYVIAKGVTEGKFKTVPQNLYLVAHYNRADIPAFDDRDNLIARLNNIRKSLVSYDLPIKIRVTFPFGDQTPSKKDDLFLSVYIRDTILLAPAGARSLAEIGKLVDCDKVVLSQDPKREKYLKENMDVLLAEDWQLFRKYALIDAEICVRYFTRLIDQYENLMGMPGASDFQLHIFAALAQEERRLTSARTKAALLEAKRRGAKLGTNGKLLALRNRTRADEFAAKIKHLAGPDAISVGYSEVARRLNRAGVRTASGAQFYPQTVKNYLLRGTKLQ